MNTKRTGSALIVVIVMMAGLLLYSGMVWRSTTYLVELSLQREQYERHYLAAFSLMQWSLALSKHYFDEVYQKVSAEPLIISLKKWPPGKSSLYAADSAFTNYAPNTLALKVDLYQASGRTHLRTVSCCLERSINDNVQGKNQYMYKVFNWKIE